MSKTVKSVSIEKPKAAKKPAAKRAPKKQLSKEEVKELLNKSIDELTLVTKELNEEMIRMKPLNLNRINELVEETIRNLEEDTLEMQSEVKEMDEKIEEPSK